MSDLQTSNALTEILAAYHALANDPPNGLTIMRALAALDKAIDEIERLSGVSPAVETNCSLPSPSDTPESAIEFIVGVAKDARFSNEYLGNVVRSWLPTLEGSAVKATERE